MENIEFWYGATNAFLRVVQPNRLGELIDSLQLNFAQSTIGVQKLVEDWPELVYYFIGYIVCLGIGLLLLVIMPVIGCCMCCCRTCCGRCGGKLAPPSQTDKCKRVAFSISILLLSTITGLSSFCALRANANIRAQTKETGGALTEMSVGFSSIDFYINRTLEDLEDSLFIPLRNTDSNISSLLTNVPDKASTTLSERTNAKRPLSALSNFARNMTHLKTYYDNIQNITSSLKELGQELERNLSATTARIEELLVGCQNLRCEHLRNTSSSIAPQANFSSIHDNDTALFPAIWALDRSVEASFPGMVDNSTGQFDQITTNIKNKTSKQLDDVKIQIKGVTAIAEDQLGEMMDPIKNVSIGSFSTILTQPSTMVDDLGQYVFIGFNSLVYLLLLITTLTILGVFFGAVCHLPQGGATCCSSRRGADCLLAGTSFVFLFYLLFTLVTMVMFLFGGLVHNEACRYARGQPEVNSSMQSVDNAVGDFLKTTLNLSNRISVMEVVQSCRQNRPLFQALNVAKTFGIDIDKLLDLKEQGVDEMLDKVRNTSIKIDQVTLITSDLNGSIYTLAEGLNAVNLTPIEVELNKKIVEGNLEEFILNLRSLENDSFREEAIKLEYLNYSLINQTRQKRVDLRENIDLATFITENAQLIEISNNLSVSEDILNNDGDAILSDIINETTFGIWHVLLDVTTSMSNDVQNRVGRCRTLYLALVQIVDLVCVGILYPLNALWFSFGICLFFFIPTIIFGTKLAGLLRKVSYGHKIGLLGSHNTVNKVLFSNLQDVHDKKGGAWSGHSFQHRRKRKTWRYNSLASSGFTGLLKNLQALLYTNRMEIKPLVNDEENNSSKEV